MEYVKEARVFTWKCSDNLAIGKRQEDRLLRWLADDYKVHVNDRVLQVKSGNCPIKDASILMRGCVVL